MIDPPVRAAGSALAAGVAGRCSAASQSARERTGVSARARVCVSFNTLDCNPTHIPHQSRLPHLTPTLATIYHTNLGSHIHTNLGNYLSQQYRLPRPHPTPISAPTPRTNLGSHISHQLRLPSLTNLGSHLSPISAPTSHTNFGSHLSPISAPTSHTNLGSHISHQSQLPFPTPILTHRSATEPFGARLWRLGKPPS